MKNKPLSSIGELYFIFIIIAHHIIFALINERVVLIMLALWDIDDTALEKLRAFLYSIDNAVK